MKTQRKHISVSHKNQSGVILVVSLIILLLLTLISLTGMQTTSLEEKMAGNMRDKNLAFQAAEAALKAGEDKVSGGDVTCSPETTRFFKATKPDIENGNFWSTVPSVDVFNLNNQLDNDRVVIQPKYIIECFSEDLYRITAYAQGATADAVVILQSVYNLGSTDTN
nr:PilX N-terminal domain-containing pilus assembly protein [Crenothrix polyspora]